MEEGNAEFGEMTSRNGPTLVVLELPRGSLSTELGAWFRCKHSGQRIALDDDDDSNFALYMYKFCATPKS